MIGIGILSIVGGGMIIANYVVWIVSCSLNIGDILVDKWSTKHNFRSIRKKKRKSSKVILRRPIEINDYNSLVLLTQFY